MSPTFLYALAAFSALFAVAVIVKVAGIWNKPDGRYQFKMWDGGLMLRGKTMGKQAAMAFAIVMALLALALIFLATEHAKRARIAGTVPAIQKLAQADLGCQPRA